MSSEQEQTRDEFIEQYAQRHPRPVKRAVVEPNLPALPRVESAARMWRFWAITTPILMLVIVSVFRVAGTFYDVARKGQYLLAWGDLKIFETANIEAVFAALAFDLAIIGLMAERVQQQRKSKHESSLRMGLALALGVTGLTNLQQGLTHFGVESQTANDLWGMLLFGAKAIFVAALSAGVPVLAAFLSSTVGALLSDVDTDNKIARDAHTASIAELQEAHRVALEQAEREFVSAGAVWQQRADMAWARSQRPSRRTDAQTDARTNARGDAQTNGGAGVRRVVRAQGEQTDERTNGHLTDKMVFALYEAQPGCSLAQGAQWLIEQYGLPNEQDKLRQVLRRHAQKLLNNGLRVDDGKFYRDHDIGAGTTLETGAQG